MRGSWCTMLSCLEHRQEGFVRLDVTPPRFVHTGGMVLCESVPPFDLEELLVPEGASGPGWATPTAWERHPEMTGSLRRAQLALF